MRLALKYIGLISLLSVLGIVHGIEPITMGVAAVGLGALGFNFIKKQTYCRWDECCDENSIPGDINKLKWTLRSNLFGQHIVQEQLIAALEAHFSEGKSRKPLVISFHGTPGTGKNYVAEMIANSLYLNGIKSKFVHRFFGRADFPEASETEYYKKWLNLKVRLAVGECPRSLFIFDEVDRIPPGVFESLTSLVDYNFHVGGNDITQAIFLFLSNTAGVQIADRLGTLMKEGTLRKDTRLSHFEQTLATAAYNADGGMKKSSLIEAHVIDHFFPFLPLEKEHVVQCIESEFSRWNKYPKKQVIQSIINEVITYDRNFGLFSTSGCKSIEKRVAIEAQLNKL